MFPAPTRKLAEKPDIDQLRRQAKELFDGFRRDEPDAVKEVRLFYYSPDRNTFALHDAQLVLARSYGFDSWPKLKAYVDGMNVSRLIEAVKANDLEQVRKILQIRPELINVSLAWDNEHAALHCAVFNRLPEMTRLLMQHGADARSGIYPNTEATTPIAIASERGYDEILAILLGEEKRRNADKAQAPAVPDELRRAINNRDEETAIAILDREPQLIHFRTADQKTILHFAAGLLLPKLAEWLLNHGMDKDVAAKDGTTPLEMAGLFAAEKERESKLTAVTNLLRDRGAQMTPRAAVILGDVDFLRNCHDKYDLITPQDTNGWLLVLATKHNRPDVLKLLLEFGLDPDARTRVDPEGDYEISFTWGMPLYECTRNGKHEMARMLLEAGADPNGQVYASGTPLSEAYGQRDDEMIALLERFGGKSNPSMAGFYRRKDLAVRLLAEFGDEKRVNDGFSSGTVAEQLVGAAARGGDPEILKLAMERVDWPDGDQRWYGGLTSSLGFFNHWIGPWCHHEWDRTTYLTCFKMILARVSPPVHQGRFGMTILHGIVTMGDHVTPEERVGFATAALDAGARLDLRDHLLKSTPLGWACRWGREELVRLFLDRGAQIVESDAEPWAQPIVWSEKKKQDRILKLLRERL
jgi:ankyrin repeat protein